LAQAVRTAPRAAPIRRRQRSRPCRDRLMCKSGQRAMRHCEAAGEEQPRAGALALSARTRPQHNAWEWQCNVCTFVNRPSMGSCEMCAFPRGAQPQEAVDEGAGAASVEDSSRCRAPPRAPPAPRQPTPATTSPAPVDAGAGRVLLAALKQEMPWPYHAAPDDAPPGWGQSWEGSSSAWGPPKSPGHELLALLKQKPQQSSADLSGGELLAALKRGGGGAVSSPTKTDSSAGSEWSPHSSWGGSAGMPEGQRRYRGGARY